MKHVLSRRQFLLSATAISAAPIFARSALARGAEAVAIDPALPRLDLHVHLDNSTIDKALEIATERKAKFGIVEHAGTKENKYPTVLSNDTELKNYLAMLQGKPVYKGVQAEWTDWMSCFSPEVLAQLDYVLTDAMTFPDKQGHRMKLWERGADLGDTATFMDRFVDWHVEIMAKEPIDIMANTSWLPQPFAAEYERHWTEPRIKKMVDAAVKYGVALEISAGMRLPKLQFLKMAKEAGVKFSFGSNGRYPNMGKLDYSLQMATELGLKPSDLFIPASTGKKAMERRKELLGK